MLVKYYNLARYVGTAMIFQVFLGSKQMIFMRLLVSPPLLAVEICEKDGGPALCYKFLDI